MPMRDDIHYIPGNTQGFDYVVGDVHGCAAELRQLLSDLGAHDRLFMVGDLFDRGPNSLAVYETIKDDPRVNVVRGNHEDVFLTCMDINLENMVLELESIMSRQTIKFSDGTISLQAAALWQFLVGGGSWALNNREADAIVLNPHLMSVSGLARYLPYFKEGLIPEVMAIRDYVAQLPYILSIAAGVSPVVGDFPAFLVCHADMPLTDDALASRPTFLTPEQINYVTYARESDFIVRRTESSIVCYCGHTPHDIGGQVVRLETNTCNLDTGAYTNSILMRVNHTRRLVDPIVGEDFSGVWSFMRTYHGMEDTEDNRIQFDCERQWYLDGPVWATLQQYLQTKYPLSSLDKPIEPSVLDRAMDDTNDDSTQRPSMHLF